MTDITTTEKFPYKREGVDAAFTLTSDAYPASIDTAEAGKLQLRMQEALSPKGDYELSISAMVNSTNLLNIPTGRLSIDGGASWEEFTVEVDTTTANKLMKFSMPMVKYSGATTDFIMQFKKSLATDTVVLEYCDMTFTRKG